MDFEIEDTGKKAVTRLKGLIDERIVTLDDVLDGLSGIYEIGFFGERVFGLQGCNITKEASHLSAGQEAVAADAIAGVENRGVSSAAVTDTRAERRRWMEFLTGGEIKVVFPQDLLSSAYQGWLWQGF